LLLLVVGEVIALARVSFLLALATRNEDLQVLTFGTNHLGLIQIGGQVERRILTMTSFSISLKLLVYSVGLVLQTDYMSACAGKLAKEVYP